MAARTLIGLAALACAGAAGAQGTDKVVWGCPGIGYAEETRVYPHGVLGDAIEYKALVSLDPRGVGGLFRLVALPGDQVFEDIAPRCADLDADGFDEIITVVSDARDGARLAIYSRGRGFVAETPPIGRGFRWLAPAGTGDFDGDGRIDIAYVETPHIGGTLRVWTLGDTGLAEIASAPGFTNHRIGQDWITGGARNCGDGDELVLASMDWTTLLAARVDGARIVQRTIADTTGPEAVRAALACNTSD